MALVAILFTTSIIFNSCGDDDEAIVGCTDPNAENYNADATESGDCVFARDKFIGNYVGSINCPDQLTTLNNDNLEFSLAEGLEVDMPSQVILSITIDNFPLALAATVEGDELTIMHMIPDVSIPDIVPGVTVIADVEADGNGTMSADEQTLMATLALEIDVTSLPIPLTLSDNCTLTGIKQ